MSIIRDSASFSTSKKAIVTVGTFDGVHLGHQEIILQVVEKAKISGLASVLLTFDPHPRKIINKINSIELINTIEEKKEKLKTLGIDYLIIQKFDEKFSETEANKFVEKTMKNNVKNIFFIYTFSRVLRYLTTCIVRQFPSVS